MVSAVAAVRFDDYGRSIGNDDHSNSVNQGVYLYRGGLLDEIRYRGYMTKPWELVENVMQKCIKSSLLGAGGEI
nr:hypothetical protein CTI12_AA013120 [Tanacetum cinerariifolium]